MDENSSPPDSSVLKELSNATTEREINDIILDPSKRDMLTAEVVRLVPSLQQRARAIQKKMAQPYYREAYAKQIQPYIDAMMVDGRNRQLNANDFPTWTIKTLYNVVRQSISYLVDHLDNKNPSSADYQKYAKFYDNELIIRCHETCVKMLLHKNKVIDFTNKITEERNETTFAEIKSYLMSFIEKAEAGQRLILPDDDKTCLPFSLNDEQIIELEAVCDKFKLVSGIFGKDKIKLIRIGEPSTA